MQIVGVRVPPPAPGRTKIIVERLLPMKRLLSIVQSHPWGDRVEEIERHALPGDDGRIVDLG
jgi:hypothetical protein